MILERNDNVEQQQSINGKGKTKGLKELLSLPAQRLRKMKESEMDIIAMLSQSAKIQYSSFQNKYNTFKEIMANFLTTNEELEEIIMEKFDKYLKPNDDKNQQAKPDKKVNNKQEKTSTHKVKDKQNQINQKQGLLIENSSKPMIMEKKAKKEPKKSRILEQKAVVKKRGQKKRKMRTQQQVSDQQSGSQQQDGDKRSRLNSLQQQKRRPISDSEITTRKGGLKMEEKIHWAESLIKERRFIYKMNSNLGEFLLLPYGVLQRLMEYNKSAQYGSGVLSE